MDSVLHYTRLAEWPLSILLAVIVSSAVLLHLMRHMRSLNDYIFEMNVLTAIFVNPAGLEFEEFGELRSDGNLESGKGTAHMATSHSAPPQWRRIEDAEIRPWLAVHCDCEAVENGIDTSACGAKWWLLKLRETRGLTFPIPQPDNAVQSAAATASSGPGTTGEGMQA